MTRLIAMFERAESLLRTDPTFGSTFVASRITNINPLLPGVMEANVFRAAEITLETKSRALWGAMNNILPGGGDLFTTQTDVTNLRALDAVYQNKNVIPIMVVADIQGILSNLTQDQLDGAIGFAVYCDSVNPPTVEILTPSFSIGLYGVTSDVGTLSSGFDFPVTFVVPAGYYYQMQDNSGGDGNTTQIVSWFEYGGTGTAV